MAQPIRRVQPAHAAARAAAARPATPPQPVRRTEEVGRGFVSTQVKDRGGVYHETDREVEVLRATFSESDPAAFVRVGAGLTINMQDYNSLRIDCAVTIPCLRGDIEAAHRIAADFVADKIAEEEANWLGQGNGKAQGKGR
jgi:hypothetical protein